MSEYRRQIALGGVVAVVLAVALGFGVLFYFPSGGVQSTTTESTTQVLTSTATTTAVSTSTATTTAVPTTTATTTATMTSVSTSTVSSATATTTYTTTATTTATSTMTSTASTTSSATTTCVLCSRLAIISANLTVNPSTSRTILSVAVKNGGSDNASNLTIALGSTKVVVIPELDSGQQTWVSIQLPIQVGIQSGETYQVTVSAQFGASVIETSTSVTATGG